MADVPSSLTQAPSLGSANVRRVDVEFGDSFPLRLGNTVSYVLGNAAMLRARTGESLLTRSDAPSHPRGRVFRCIELTCMEKSGVPCSRRTFCDFWAESREGPKIGGPGRDRTDDLFHAMEARSQLRHRPTPRKVKDSSYSRLAAAIRSMLRV
jgi:hypothetical protein